MVESAAHFRVDAGLLYRRNIGGVKEIVQDGLAERVFGLHNRDVLSARVRGRVAGCETPDEKCDKEECGADQVKVFPFHGLCLCVGD